MRHALAIFALLAPTMGRDSSSPPARPVIPPGREALVLDMLGGGDVMPGDCRLVGARVDRSHVVGRYACGAPAHEVVIELRHPSEAAAGAIAAGPLAVVPGKGTPEPLPIAIAARVRARGEGWTWLWPEQRSEVAARPIFARPYRWLFLAVLFAIPLLGVTAREVWRRTRHRASG